MRSSWIAIGLSSALVACSLSPPHPDVTHHPGDEGEGDGAGEGEGEGEGGGEGEGAGEGEGGAEGEGEGENTCGGVIAMFDRAVCFVDSSDALQCAGRRGETVFGASFVPAGQTGVRQIIGSVTTNNDSGSAVCVRRADGVALCLGYSPNVGALNANAGINWQMLRPITGEEPGPTWTQWGTRSDVVELVTGTMDQVCARYADGTADCTAFVCGLAGAPQSCPTFSDEAAHHIVDLGAVNAMWVDTAGMVHENDTDVLHASAGRSECQIANEGLRCVGSVVSPPSLAGHIVDGGFSSQFEIPCWLTDAGDVSCNVVGFQLFAGHTVIALAVNPYSAPAGSGVPSACAVIDDGSVWCIGNNALGRLGTGDDADVLEEQQVAPPGSARISCDP